MGKKIIVICIDNYAPKYLHHSKTSRSCWKRGFRAEDGKIIEFLREEICFNGALHAAENESGDIQFRRRSIHERA